MFSSGECRENRGDDGGAGGDTTILLDDKVVPHFMLSFFVVVVGLLTIMNPSTEYPQTDTRTMVTTKKRETLML
jgi:hypothetical protein